LAALCISELHVAQPPKNRPTLFRVPAPTIGDFPVRVRAPTPFPRLVSDTKHNDASTRASSSSLSLHACSGRGHLRRDLQSDSESHKRFRCTKALEWLEKNAFALSNATRKNSSRSPASKFLPPFLSAQTKLSRSGSISVANLLPPCGPAPLPKDSPSRDGNHRAATK
jgi:hypothetical protein